MKEKSRQKRLRLLAEAKKKPAVFTVYVVLRLIVVAILVSSILRGEYENAAICLLVLFLFLLPLFVQRNFGIELPGTLEIIILVFIFASEILGELGCFFINVPNWDSILHTTTGFLCAAFGFALIDILNRNDKIKFQLSPIYVALVAFCFSMTIGVLWEFFEFSVDRLFHMDMQKDTIVHTISSVMLDPTNKNIPITIDGITSVAVNGKNLGFDGYLDIGLYDTMEGLFDEPLERGHVVPHEVQRHGKQQRVPHTVGNDKIPAEWDLVVERQIRHPVMVGHNVLCDIKQDEIRDPDEKIPVVAAVLNRSDLQCPARVVAHDLIPCFLW